jgi:hypothetical protein
MIRAFGAHGQMQTLTDNGKPEIRVCKRPLIWINAPPALIAFLKREQKHHPQNTFASRAVSWLGGSRFVDRLTWRPSRGSGREENLHHPAYQ